MDATTGEVVVVEGLGGVRELPGSREHRDGKKGGGRSRIRLEGARLT